MINLIDAGMEYLMEAGDAEYIEKSRVGHALKDSVLPGLKNMAEDKSNRTYKVLAQALFESGFLSATERCFNLDQLLAHIYGVKVSESMSVFLELHGALMKAGHTGWVQSNMFNPSGDNRYSAFEYQVKPTEDDNLVRELFSSHIDKPVEPFRTDVIRKVIYIENQSPAFAVVLDYSIHTGEPKYMYLVQIKPAYDCPGRLNDLIDTEFDLSQPGLLSAYDTLASTRLITTLDVVNGECKPVLEPAAIEHVLFSIYSGRDAINDEHDDNR